MDFRVLYPDVAENLFLRLTPIVVEKLISYANLQETKWELYLNTKPKNLESGTYYSKFIFKFTPHIKAMQF
jgi:hypothetical protein